MATAQYFDNYSSTLASGYTSGGVSLVVTSATLLPSVGNFELTVDRGLASEEQFLCTARSGTTLTVAGAQGNTSASNHSAGATVDGAILGTTTMNQIRKDKDRTLAIATFDALASTEYRQGDVVRFSDAHYHAVYNGSSWDYFYGSIPVTRPPAIGSWTWDNQGTSTANTTNGALYANFQRTGFVKMAALYVTAPAAPYTVTGLFLLDNSGLGNSSSTQDAVGGGLIFRDGTGKILRFNIGYDSGFTILTQKWTDSNTALATYLAITSAVGVLMVGGVRLVWMRIKDDNTNLIFQLSIDGYNWKTFDTRARTLFFGSGPTQVGIGSYVFGNDSIYQLLSWVVT